MNPANFFSKSVYQAGVSAYHAAAALAAPFSQKAKDFTEGRKQAWTKLEEVFKANERPVVWIHCSSLGEFEQGRPVLEAIRERNPDCHLLLTFFSPSGYNIRKNYPVADLVCYLPMDSASNAQRFLKTVRPSLAIFVKYEFWYHYLTQLKHLNIPTILICGIFRKNQPFFKWYGDLFREMLQSFTHLFLQDRPSADLLGKTGFSENKCSIAGDTRFDRVIQIASNPAPLPEIARFCRHKIVIVAGSTWQADEEHLFSAFENLKKFGPAQLIIAPHNINTNRVKEVEKKFSNWKTILHSQLAEKEPPQADILIIDNIGMLSSIYRFGSWAYIGGGFGSGIHNILEAAVFSIPVVFGPAFHKFREASDLIASGGGFSVDGTTEMTAVFEQLAKNELFKNEAGRAAGAYVSCQAGGTEKILKALSGLSYPNGLKF